MATSNPDKELVEVQDSYRKRIEGLDRKTRKDQFWDRIRELSIADDYDEAVRTLEQELHLCETSEDRLELQQALSNMLKRAGKPEESLAYLEAILATESIDGRLRQRVHSKRVELLFYELQRKEEAIASAEEWVANAEHGSRERWVALAWKAKLASADNPGSPDATSAWKSARDVCELHGNDWLTCTSGIAEAEIAAGNPDRGAAIFDQIISLLEKRRSGELDSHFPWTWKRLGAGYLILSADAHSESGKHPAALDRLLRAEADIESQLNELDPALSHKVDATRTRLEEVRASISKERASVSKK